ncbi:MAG: ABC transporter ATP-binding protein [Gammaproteobacteria bacterium]|nr:ABC transporter ATP-binding protein [Gammaproteobacteria bacterium]
MSENKQDTVIEVRNLVTHYGDREILSGVDLDINRGEIRVIMGGSGSGKTTLFRHLLGLNRPSSGVIKLLGKDINAIKRSELYQLRKELGVAFQNGALLGSLSVGENIRLPLKQHTDLDDNITNIMMRLKLELVSLSGFEDLMPSELSGGMLKRTALARAVIMDPQLLFFDEPSAGLDPVVSAELDELILRLRDSLNMTIVVVTHELDSAFKIADRITVLGAGKVLTTGTVDEVKNSDNEHIQNMLNRRPGDDVVNAEEYLQRLTGGKC